MGRRASPPHASPARSEHVVRIGIDIRPLSWLHDRAGIYQTISHVVTHLMELAPDHQYVLLSTRGGPPEADRFSRGRVRKLPARLSSVVLERLGAPVECLLGRMAVFYGPSFFVPRTLRCRTVVTLHDVMFMRHPEFLHPEWVDSLKKMVGQATSRADAVIAVSEFTKRELVECLGLPEQRIHVIPNGIGPGFCQIADQARLDRARAKYDVTAPYALFVGRLEPKKNLGTLIRAWHEMRRMSGQRITLVVAGSKGPSYPALRGLARELGVERDIRFTGAVEGPDLPALYAGAELFVFPSLYEGFGIPVLEAMACGTPVVASTCAAVSEVAGDAALAVDPTNVEELAAAMSHVITQSELRRKLVESGLRRAKEFSWARTARGILALCEDLGGGRNGARKRQRRGAGPAEREAAHP